MWIDGRVVLAGMMAVEGAAGSMVVMSAAGCVDVVTTVVGVAVVVAAGAALVGGKKL